MEVMRDSGWFRILPWLVCGVLASTSPAAARDPLDEIERLAESAGRSLADGEPDKAESELLQAAGIALDQLGAIYTALTDYSRAEEAYAQACQSTVLTIYPFLGRAIVYLRTGRLEEGVQLLTQILELNPTHADAKHLLGKFYYLQGRFGAAARELRDAYTFAPEDTSVAYTLALAYLEQRDLERAGEVLREIGARLGESPALHILFGRAYRETEYWSEAVEEFKKALALDPRYPRGNYYLGLTYLLWEGAAAFDRARDYFLRELELDPDQYFPNLYLGVIHTMLRDDAAAARYLERAIALDPGNPDPHLYLGQILGRGAKLEEAVAALRRSIELTTDPSRNSYQVSNSHYVLGQTLLKLGRREEARSEIARSQELKRLQSQAARAEFVRKTESGTSTAQSGMSQDLRDLTDVETAVILDEPPPDEETRQALERAERRYRSAAAGILSALARLESERRNYPAAAGYLARASRWDSTLPDVRYNLAVARLRGGHMEGAVTPLLEHLREHPDHASSRHLLADLALQLVQRRRGEAALEAIDHLLEDNPVVPELWVLRGQAFAQMGNYDASLENFQRSLQIRPGLEEVHFYSGMSLIRQGRLAEALVEFDAELDRDPDHSLALYHKAFVLITQHRLDEALPLLQRVVSLRPDYAEAYYQLGKIQIDRNQLLPAVANLETAGNLDPKSYIYYQLSRAYARSGRREAAERAIDRYRELKRREDEARDARTRPQ
jgi:tetratricopeptide (TPR) repeat protein